MSSGKPRSPLGGNLRVTCFPRPGSILFRAGAAIALLQVAFPGLASSQEERPTGALDQAVVEPFDYTEPPADLSLDEDGERKRKALLLYYRGTKLRDSDTPAALNYYKQVLELDPSNVALARETATLCAVFGKFSEARAILEESLSQNEGDRDAYLNLSRYCDTYHNDDEELKAYALEYAEMAYEKLPQDHVVIEYYAKMLIDRDQKEEAEEVLEESLKIESKVGEFWLAMGSIAQAVWPMRNEKNRERVMGVYEKALRSDPENLDMVERVAQFLAASGSTERALQLYQALVRRSPDRLIAREAMADLLWQSGNHEQSVATLEAIVQINPDAIDVRRKLTDMYLELKDLRKALEHCEFIVESGDGEVGDYLRLAEFQRVVDRLGGALQTLREGVSTFPDSPRLSYSLGMLYLRLERFAEAFGALETAERQGEASHPDFLDEGFYFDYAVTAERAAEFERAAELFRKSIELVPEESKEDKAKSLNYMGYMWLEREENINEAGELIKEANELKPDNGAYLDSLGWFHFLKGEFDEAIKHLKRAEELLEDEPDSVIFEHLAHAYLAKGDREKAMRYVNRALELEPEKKELKTLREKIEKSA